MYTSSQAVSRDDRRFVATDLVHESIFSPVNVVQFLTSFGFGGTERQVEHLVRKLDRGRFAPRLACLKKWGHFLEDFEQQQLPITTYPIKTLYQPLTFRLQWQFASDLRKHRVQICHSYNFYANTFALPAARLARVPLIIASIRDTGMNMTPAKMYVHKQVCRFADQILVNAEAIRQWLVRQGYPYEKISVIYNGIDLSRFTNEDHDGALRSELRIPQQAPLVLVLARLAPEKGIESFIDAAAQVLQRCPQAYFLIVGERFSGQAGSGLIEPDMVYRKSLTDRANQLGIGERVLFTGYRSDVPWLLAQADVSVLPSLAGEGLSNTLLESMAAGTPVVATRIGGNAEVIAQDGIEGLLVPPADPQALAEAISAVLTDPERARALSSAAKQRVHKHFSLERMVRSTEDIYQNLLRQSTRNKRLHIPNVPNPN